MKQPYELTIITPSLLNAVPNQKLVLVTNAFSPLVGQNESHPNEFIASLYINNLADSTVLPVSCNIVFSDDLYVST